MTGLVSNGRFRIVAGALICVLALGCDARAQTSTVAAYVVLGEDGAAVARVITSAARCPSLAVEGKARAMQVRAAPETVPQRPTQSTPENSKPSAFPVLTCEATLPAGARTASVEGRRLPVPAPRADRIVVIGDTGCRLKASESAYQDCNDAAQYPFAAIAAKAAAWKPDLVVHVGDLIYRENPCPQGKAGCAGSAWGYGLDAWKADFFDPGAPLLRAAPWVMARGNHESCTRAGQGWWRFMDPRPLAPGRDCNDPSQDVSGDYSDPYAVPIGEGSQIVVMDLSIAGGKPIADTDPRAAEFRETYAKLDELARRASYTFAVDHYPILGVSADEKAGAVALQPGNAGIQSVFGPLGANMLPDRVDVLLAGHVHLWEQVSFSTAHPSQFIAGFSGTQEDVAPVPAQLPADFEPAPGARVDHFSSWVDGFGYMTMERRGARSWKVTVWNAQGAVMNRCSIEGRRSQCERAHLVGSR